MNGACALISTAAGSLEKELAVVGARRSFRVPQTAIPE